MDILKKVKYKMSVLSYAREMPEQDVEQLATMCKFCGPKVVQHGLLIRRFAYYIPQSDADMEKVYDLFAKNGIYMQKHYTHVIDSMGQNSLRVSYARCINGDVLEKQMRRIKDQYTLIQRNMMIKQK